MRCLLVGDVQARNVTPPVRHFAHKINWNFLIIKAKWWGARRFRVSLLRPMQWHREITRQQWRTLVAAQLGWMLDAMDVMLYSFALTTIRAEFHLSSAAAGALGAAPLVTSALGGILFGWLSDRFGRARALMWSILAFSAFTGFTATSRSVGELVFWRAIVGIGLGGEWAAGSVLVAETWPAEHRGKAIGLMQSAWAVGYLLAALLAAGMLP